jgi:cell division protein FtsJ
VTGGGSGREGGRALKTRVKTARKRSLSSTLWLERQLNDPYVAQAKREGYRSRAAFKLLEIADKYRLLKPGQRIVDLGAAPGGWSQVAAEATGAKGGSGRVIAIDVLEMDPVEGVEFRQMDFHDPEAPRHLREWLAGPADGVLSDMAANATGHRKTDHLRIVGLVRPPEARLRQRAPREAESEPRRQRRALPFGDRVQGSQGRELMRTPGQASLIGEPHRIASAPRPLRLHVQPQAKTGDDRRVSEPLAPMLQDDLSGSGFRSLEEERQLAAGADRLGRIVRFARHRLKAIPRRPRRDRPQ